MAVNIQYRHDGAVLLEHKDGYTYIIKGGNANWRFRTDFGSSYLEPVPIETGFRRPLPPPSAPLATEEQYSVYKRSLAARKLALFYRLMKARKEKADMTSSG